MAKNPKKHALMEALRGVLKERQASTQENLCVVLAMQGYEVNQSKVSRLLRKIGAVKSENDRGEFVYSLPREPGPPTMLTPLSHLIMDVTANETIVVIYTSPGCASMIARLLDYQQIRSEILGTVAGDDTIFVAPKSTKNIRQLYEQIKDLLLPRK